MKNDSRLRKYVPSLLLFLLLLCFKQELGVITTS